MVHLIIANWWEKRTRILTASLFRRTTKWWVYVGRWASSENKHVSMMFAHLINRQHVWLLSDVYWTQTWIDTVLAHLSLYTQKLGLNPETEIWCAEWSFLWVSDMMKSFFGIYFGPEMHEKFRKSWRKWGRFPAAQKLSGEEIGNESPTQDAYLGLDSFLWLKFWVVRIRLKKCKEMYVYLTYMYFVHVIFASWIWSESKSTCVVTHLCYVTVKWFVINSLISLYIYNYIRHLLT